MSSDRPADDTAGPPEPTGAAPDRTASDGPGPDTPAPGDVAPGAGAAVGDGAVDDDASKAGASVLPWRGLWLIATAVLVYALDLGTKILAVAALEGKPPVEVLGGAVYLQLIRNPGAAFSMATGMTWLFTLIAAGVVVAIIWILPKLRSTGWALGLGLVLAGALGNLTDRLFRAPGMFEGHVVDFVSVLEPNGAFFPVFNVADSGITVGGVLIVLLTLLGRDYDGTLAKKKEGKSAA